VHTIVIHGADHRPAVADMQPAFDQMSAIFAQKTAKLLIHHTSVVYEDEALLDVLYEFYNNNNPETTGTFARLFAQTAGVQKEDALNVFLVREFSVSSSLGGIAPIAGLSVFPQSGDRNAAVVVFLKGKSYIQSGLDELGWRVVGGTMSHEAGHGLGLQHTDYPPDPLVETPYGTERNIMDLIGDRDFLINYVAEITGEQGYVMRLNPLTYIPGSVSPTCAQIQ